ncbi:hypothetical protein [Natranaerobius thermophilus]|uniref:Uncharacterized protein n=1 Tax=Natranaerobius thermophilus (strain ATCC BAA-1301 / DSM 18059 / JW/NM-WN-LF) TaxID=457570 RepID=B2A831_NATTJ|nr:hypothetical protein [Natranaerobius thermophilus]ACB85829.1 hypothetical protein Nther_2263 [Natranaerobius thermophilus JW/NM-WN-LF]
MEVLIVVAVVAILAFLLLAYLLRIVTADKPKQFMFSIAVMAALAGAFVWLFYLPLYQHIMEGPELVIEEIEGSMENYTEDRVRLELEAQISGGQILSEGEASPVMAVFYPENYLDPERATSPFQEAIPGQPLQKSDFPEESANTMRDIVLEHQEEFDYLEYIKVATGGYNFGKELENQQENITMEEVYLILDHELTEGELNNDGDNGGTDQEKNVSSPRQFHEEIFFQVTGEGKNLVEDITLPAFILYAPRSRSWEGDSPQAHEIQEIQVDISF